MPDEPLANLVTEPFVLSKIPAFPPIVLRALDLLANDDVEIRELTDLILSDAVFSAQLLRLANSPQFGHKSQIDSLHHALVTLGLDRVQALAMTVATGNYMKAALKIEELRRCWRHTLACAVLSQELARTCGIPDDRAYSVGLLHDIGRLGLLVTHPAEYAQLLRDADRDSLGLLDQETRRFGIDHCTAGRLLSEHWHLPQDFAVVAGRHHDPPSGGEPDLLMVVHLGCRLSDVLGFGVVTQLAPATCEEVLAALPEHSRQRMVCDAEVLREAVERRLHAHDRLDTPEARTREEEPEEEPAPVEAAGEARPGSLTSDLTVVISTGLIFTVVLLVVYYFWAR